MAKPCKECPFNRQVTAGALGGSPPEVYVGQTIAGFWLPCHMANNYAGKASDVNEVRECTGCAITRANMGLDVSGGGLLVEEPDHEAAFSTLAEFYAHHSMTTVAEAERLLTDDKLRELAQNEFQKASVRMQLKRRKA